MKPLIAFILIVMLSGCNHLVETTNKVEIADSTLCQLGEGAFWDGANMRLFYVDITGSKLFAYYPETGKKSTWDMPSMIGTVVPEDSDHVIVALTDGIYRFELSSSKFTFLIRPLEHTDSQRFNDGKTDPSGRLWVGSISLQGEEKKSFLYKIEHDSVATSMLDGITISNGIAWSSDGRKMYYIDTPTRVVREYEYNLENGTIRNATIAVAIPDSLGSPDGMTIDDQNMIWVAMWGGSSVCRFNPDTGELLEQIKVPAKNVTSCAFGGKDRNILFITTASNYDDTLAQKMYPDAGSLFKVKTGYSGPQFINYIN